MVVVVRGVEGMGKRGGGYREGRRKVEKSGTYIRDTGKNKKLEGAT